MQELIPTDPTNAGGTAGIFSVVILGLVGIYQGWKKLRSDFRDERNDKSVESFKDSLLKRLKEVEDRQTLLTTERDDAVKELSKARTDSAQQISDLSSEIKLLHERLSTLEQNKKHEIERLTNENIKLKTQVSYLMEMLGFDENFIEILDATKNSMPDIRQLIKKQTPDKTG